ncbi:MAG: DUF1887 family protein [Methanoregula sp.]|nr:DUF1887 family protein [Methanoregula sp.]
MITLVCIISAQHIPNLLTVKAVRPGHLILIVTNQMKKNAPWFLNALAAGGLDYSKKHTIIGIQKENSFDEIRSSLKAAYEQDPEKDWILNITGGTKPMSIGAYMFAQENRLRALYIVESDQQNAIDLSGGDPLSLSSQHVTDAEFLAGYGYEIRNAGALEKLNQRAESLMDLAALLTTHHDDEDLRHFLGMLQEMKARKETINRKRWLREGLVLTEDDRVILRTDKIRREIALRFGLVVEGGVMTGHMERYAAEFLTGKWLEYFVYGLLRPLVPSKVRCLRSGLSIGLPGMAGENELDVSFMTERSLCMVECKTGSQGHDAKGEQVIYKTEAIKEGLGALRAKAFIATTSPNILDRNTGDTRESLANRGQIYGCTIINGKVLRELAGLYLTKNPTLDVRVAGQFNLT